MKVKKNPEARPLACVPKVVDEAIEAWRLVVATGQLIGCSL